MTIEPSRYANGSAPAPRALAGRLFFLCAAAFLWLIPSAAHAQASTTPARPPNIVVILADDLGWTDLGVYGSTFYETPNLDRLAGQGMRFTNAYAACPVCSPTRASLLTGQYPARVGVTDYLFGKARGRLLPAEYTDHLPLELTTLPEALKARGYATWHVGKWHLGREPYYPQHQGYDVNVAGSSRGSPNKTYFSPWNLENLPDGPPGQYLTDRLTDEAIRLIQDNGDQPFFLSYWSYAPHIPLGAPEALIEKYRQKAKRLKLDEKQALVEQELFPIEKKKTRHVARRRFQSDPVYAAVIENLDWNIGRLLQAIDASGQARETLVIFASDNGGLATAENSPTCNAPLREGKGFMYEGGIRVPMIVRYAGVKAGLTCDVPVTTPDLFPTILAVAGANQPAGQALDGVNLLPLLHGGDHLDREAIFWHYPHYGNQGGIPASAVRAGDWKLIEFFENPRLELYNLRTDVSEQHDLTAGQPEKVKELKEMLDDWRREVGARYPRPNPAWIE